MYRPKIFVSYRQQLDIKLARDLTHVLEARFGYGSVLWDGRGDRKESDYRQWCINAIRTSDILICMISPNWLNLKDDSGARRLDNRLDMVRQEIEEALRLDKIILPILVENAEMPKSFHLPDAIHRLSYYNGLRWSAETKPEDLYLRIQDLLSGIRTLRKYKCITIALGAAVLGAIFVICVLVQSNYHLASPSGVFESLSRLDENAFVPKEIVAQSTSDSEVQKYKLPNAARVFQDRESLHANGSLASAISDATSSFDFFAPRGSAIAASEISVRAAIARGVKIRILLIDHGLENEANLEAYRHAHLPSLSLVDLRNISESSLALAKLTNNVDRKSGNFEVRTVKVPILSSFWIRDFGPDAVWTKTTLAHLEVISYQLNAENLSNISFRFSAMSPKVVSKLQTQFDALWVIGAKQELSRPLTDSFAD